VREAQELSTSPSPDYIATPLENDIFEWHFTLRGPPNSAFADGVYHGRIVLPPAYPLRPPSFRFLTPSGRFEPNREICLSISGHHEETWQPAWGVRTALVALRSFMETDPTGQLGGVDAPDAVRKRLAAESTSFRCGACARTNAEIIAACEEDARRHEEENGGSSARAEVEIPQELRMGFRDEMEKAKAEAQKSPEAPNDDEVAELAEGFVQTVPEGSASSGPVPAALDPAAVTARFSQPGSAIQQPAVSQPVPQPTRTIPAPAVIRVQAQAPVPPRVSTDDVPAWIDRLIVVLAVLLAAMVLKVFMA
jgi:ubiquitin-conjugating enzyme E2 J1